MYQSVDIQSGMNANGDIRENGRATNEYASNKPYSQLESPVSPNSDLTMDHIIKAFKVEITASGRNHLSQLLMILSSGMYVVTTTKDAGAIYYLSLIISIAIMINIVALIVFIVARKRVFKKSNMNSPVAKMQRTIKLQKIYGILSIVLFLLQLLFTIITGLHVTGVTDKTDTGTTTVPMVTTIATPTTAMNNTFG